MATVQRRQNDLGNHSMTIVVRMDAIVRYPLGASALEELEDRREVRAHLRISRSGGDEGAMVVALDLAPSMLERAREAAGPFAGPVVRPLAADMEQLPLADGIADLVLANASFNLALDKHAAFAEAARILRPGGRLVARDLVLDGPLPPEIAQNSAAWNTSLGGVLDQDDLYEALRAAGFVDIRISHHQPFSVVAAVRIQAVRPPAAERPVRTAKS